MLKKLVSTAFCAAILMAASASASPLNSWIGTWEKSSGSLVSVTVSNNGGVLKVNAKGQCTPNPCDWGTVNATAFSPNVSTGASANTQAIIAVFNQGFATKTLLLQGQSGDNLRYRTFTRFTDGSGRSDYTNNGILKRKRLVFVPPGGPILVAKPFKEDCIDINPNAVSVARKNGRWKLVQGNMWILDAGPNRNEMLRARQIVQRYGLNKQCFVGRPNPSLRYWLTDNKSPQGAIHGEDCVSINPNGLTVSRSGSIYRVLSNGNHSAFAAPSEAEAREIISVIKYYGFTKSCFVGRPDPSMAYLRK